MSSPPNPSANDANSGLSVLDLAELPPDLYQVMRLMLREVEIRYSVLCQRVAALPENPLSTAQLDQVLQKLIDENWLIRSGDVYRANLRKKANRTLSEFQPQRRKTGTLRTIWDSLENPDKPNQDEQPH